MTSASVTTGDDLGVRVSGAEGVTGADTSTLLAEHGTSAGPSPDEYAASFQMALNVADLSRPRSVQTDGGILGASDFGGCTHKAVLTIRQTPPSNVPKKGKARIGTALHAAFLTEVQQLFPQRLIEPTLTVTLPSGAQVPLHPDEIDPDEPSVTDYKFVSDLALVRRVGLSDQQHMQRNLQALAAIQAGILPAEGVTVRNLFVSMTDTDDVWVQQEPFSMDWVNRADDWGHTVRYAVEHDEDGAKDAPFYFCKDFCPFFAQCKPPLTDAMGELTSVALREAVLTCHSATEERKQWEKVEKQAKDLLRGISGRVEQVSCVSTWVNSGKGYWKVETRDVT